jgi:hypothetical protein
MGARGLRAHPVNRRPHKNRRPGPRQRARTLDLSYGTAPYWNLVTGEQDWRPAFWPDPFDPERERVWEAERQRIFARWPKQHGQRPDGWWSFDMPPLLVKAWMARRFTMKQTDAWDHLEYVFHLDANEAEREQIREIWRRWIETAAYLRESPADVRRKALEWDVPAWFYDRERSAANVVVLDKPQKRRRRRA